MNFSRALASVEVFEPVEFQVLEINKFYNQQHPDAAKQHSKSLNYKTIIS